MTISVVFSIIPFVTPGTQGLVNWVWVAGILPNGTIFDYVFPASSSTVTPTGLGASGSWEGTGCSFQGSPDLSTYTVTINNAFITGSLTLNFIAPPCYPDGNSINAPRASYAGPPGTYWSNSIPAGVAKCNISVIGTPVIFQSKAGYS